MTPVLIFESRSELDTARLGSALARTLPARAVVALHGTLGAGKTRLVQALAEACGIDRREVVSPTFVLIQEHQGQRALWHIDAYRIRDEDEFLDLGPDEYYERDGLVLIEWADRVASALPPERVEITIEVTGAESRRMEIAALGPAHAGLLDRLRAALAVSCT